MIPHFKVSETVDARARMYFHLVDATDGITPAVAEAGGQPQISKNGGAPANTTNTLVAVDASSMPGLYYVVLTPVELETYGFIVVRYKSSNTAEYQIIGQVVAEDPYAITMTGAVVMGGGNGNEHKFTVAMANDIAERVWKVKIDGKKTAQTVLNEKSTFDVEKQEVMIDQEDMSKNIAALSEQILAVFNKKSDFAEVIEAINSLPAPKDYKGDFKELGTFISGIEQKLTGDFSTLRESIDSFEGKMNLAKTDIEEAVGIVDGIVNGFNDLKDSMESYGETLGEQTDMDKRLAAMSGNLQSNELTRIADSVEGFKTEVLTKIGKLAELTTTAKFDILEELNGPGAKAPAEAPSPPQIQ